MSKLSFIRRAGTAVVATALAVTVVAEGGAAQAAPADHGADWLSSRLNSGVIVDGGFPSYGLTIDTAFALKAIGGHRIDLRHIRKALQQHVTDYTGSGAERYAGPTAKLLVAAQTLGADPRSFGGFDLVHRLNRLVTRSGPAKGRIADQSAFGDFANTVGQILAVRGLTAAGSHLAGATRRFLLEQQCSPGYFRLDFARPQAPNQSCGKNSPADPDATSYAVVELWKTSKGHPAFRAALKRAVGWLLDQQRPSGAFIGGTSTATPNTNSTGLAGWALGITGKCGPARKAAIWVQGLQVGVEPNTSPLAGERGAIAKDFAAFKAGERDGITSDTEDSWLRATPQAAPSLLFRHGC
jgi:hypothetical protein